MLLDAALEYANHGLQVVRLHHPLDSGACSCTAGLKCPQQSRGKHPSVGNEWEKKATTDEDTIVGWWEQMPEANIGIKLGPASGIIDIEFDTEQGKRTAAELLGECYTPTYSSLRSIHRWFRWSPRLPDVQKLDVRGLEIRIGGGGKAAQSVAPPSLHWSGTRYAWLGGLSLSDVDFEDIPEPLMRLICGDDDVAAINGVDLATAGRGSEFWDRVSKGVGEGQRNESLASFVGAQLRDLRNIDDEQAVKRVLSGAQGWNKLNNPPLDREELEKTFISILKREQARRAAEESSLRSPPEVLARIDKTTGVNGWRLEIVDSEPRTYKLFSPLWAGRVKDGCIVLTKEQMTNPNRIKQEALEQASYPLPANFGKVWNGTADKPGMYERLVMSHENSDAPIERKRRLVVAQWLHLKLAKAQARDEPDPRGTPTLVDGIGITFSFNAVWEEMAYSADRVKRDELSDVCEAIGVDSIRHRASDKRVRLKVCNSASLKKLEQMIGLSEPTEATV